VNLAVRTVYRVRGQQYAPQNFEKGGKRPENRNPQGKPPADSCFPIIFIQIYTGEMIIMGW